MVHRAAGDGEGLSERTCGRGEYSGSRTGVPQEIGREPRSSIRHTPTSVFPPSDLLLVPPISQAQLKGGGREESR